MIDLHDRFVYPNSPQAFVKPTSADLVVPDRPMNGLYKFGLVLMWLSIGFDFKSKGYIDDPLSIQITVICGFFLGFLICFYSVAKPAETRERIPNTVLYCVLWCIFSTYIGLITLIRGSDLFELLKNMVPYGGMCLGMIFFIRHVQAGYSLDILMRFVVIACLIATVWAYINGRISSNFFDEDPFAFIEDIRWTILSSALLPVFGWVIYQLSKGRNIIINSAILSFIAFVVLVSKTRGPLLGIATVLPFVILVSERRLRTFIKTICIVGTMASTALAFTQYVHKIDLLEVWRLRIFGTEYQTMDVTTFTRLAEYKGQMDRLFQDIPSAIFGRGLFDEIAWDPYISYLIDWQGFSDTYEYNRFVRGVHSTWVNSFFHGGLLVGWWPTLAFGFTAAISLFFALFRREAAAVSDSGKAAMAMFLAAFLPMSTGLIFIERIGPLVIGLVSTFSILEWERWKTRRRIRGHQESIARMANK